MQGGDIAMTTGGVGRYLKTKLAVDPTAFVAPGASLVGEVTLGAESSLWYGVVARGDMEPIVIGRQTNVQDNSVIHVDQDLPTFIGDNVTIGHRAVIHGCVIEDGALIGIGAIVLSGARVGKGALVAAGALVREGLVVPPGSLFAGVPGKVLRQLTEGEMKRVAANSLSYVEYARRYRSGELG
jgi:carbonic anhydrase/acetyltransferase-like protein (isoleucine patch superfamily)